MAPLSKADILRGHKGPSTEDVYINALDGEVTIKRLTDGQNERIKVIKMGGLNIGMDMSPDMLARAATQNMEASDIAREAINTGGVQVDLGKMQEASYEADVQACAWGLSVNEAWTPAEVRDMAPGAPAEIARHIYRLTDGGVSQADLTAFREDEREPGDDDLDQDGVLVEGASRPDGAPTELAPNRSTRRSRER